ncbi:MAG: RNA 2',3'-cyclic phosphodiesterase [Hymenobacteraceae bacterium]|nr:RNA 2',3'-cyclic phosphodiesterase [Hymenobacteraceae bacterium]
MTRLFIAAPLPDKLKHYLTTLASHYKDEPIRQIPEENLHLTLYFIGNVPAEQLTSIQEVTAHISRQFGPFELQLEAIEPGPKPRSPRLIWARFESSEPFAQLSNSLTQALSSDPPLDRAAIPHITLSRFRKDRPAPRNLEAILPESPVTLQVNEIAVWHSELGSPHPRYSILHTYPLKGNQPEPKTV